jgi:hypothetical protein
MHSFLGGKEELDSSQVKKTVSFADKKPRSSANRMPAVHPRASRHGLFTDAEVDAIQITGN